jgi:drug/metabolite transporter (DMT)-like permease
MEINTTIKKSSDNDLFIWGSFFVLTLAWGSSFILVKRGMVALSPWQVASLRLATAGLALSPIAFKYFKTIPPPKLKYIAIVGFTGLGIPAYMFCAAQLGLSSSLVGVLNALTPAFTFIIGISFFGQKAKGLQMLGLLIGFAGSAILILVNAKGQVALNAYALFVVAATVCYGINTNLVKKYLVGINPTHMTAVSVTIVGALALIHLLTTDFLTVAQTAPHGWASLAAAVTLGLVGTAFAQIVFNRLLAISSAVFASSITYFIPIVAVMWGVWDGEVLLLWHYLGMACIIGGILILNKSK